MWAKIVVNPECPLTGHFDAVTRVAFSGDGAHVVSASGRDNTVRLFEVASGRQVRQLVGNNFALVEGLSGEHKRVWHVITVNRYWVRIYKCAEEQQHAGDGAVEAPVACFKAPQHIITVQCFGATICVGCVRGPVCILSALFLAA
jgi:WD40 repeat protein